MANFDMAELALKSVCPNNAMKVRRQGNAEHYGVHSEIPPV